VLLDPLVHLLGDFGLHLRYLVLLAQQQKDLFHAIEQGNGVQDILQVMATGTGNGGARSPQGELSSTPNRER